MFWIYLTVFALLKCVYAIYIHVSAFLIHKCAYDQQILPSFVDEKKHPYEPKNFETKKYTYEINVIRNTSMEI